MGVGRFLLCSVLSFLASQAIGSAMPLPEESKDLLKTGILWTLLACMVMAGGIIEAIRNIDKKV